MQEKIYIGTWKMNLSLDQSTKLAYEYAELGLSSGSKIFGIAPSLLSISAVKNITENSNLNILAQNCSIKDGYGAFTGEISARMLKDADVWGVILGHSERRIELNETDNEVNQKVKNVLQNKMKAVLCIGEELNIRDGGKTNEFIEEQLYASIDGVNNEDLENLIIAYEPVWAISSAAVKRTPTEEEVISVIAFIKSLIEKKYQSDAPMVKILYGGSVNPDNISVYNSMEDIDGYLIGSASLDAQKYKEITN